MSGYVDEIEERCKDCKFHEVFMVDADMVASYCHKAKKYVCQVKDCSNWNKINK